MTKRSQRLINVFVIEDNPGDSRLLSELLAEEPSCSVLGTATTLHEGLEWLDKGGVDVVLVDPTLPDSRGIETVSAVHAQVPTVPLVVVSGTTDDEFACEAIRHGAQDYLAKGTVDSRQLIRVIRHALERAQAQHQVARLASLLDGTPNPVIATDPDGVVNYLNPSAQRTFPDVRRLGLRHPVLAGLKDGAGRMRDARQPVLERELQVGARVYTQRIVADPAADGIRVYLVDVTARKEAEERLGKAHAQTEQLLASVSSILIGVSLDGRITTWNAVAETVFGLDAAEVLARPLTDKRIPWEPAQLLEGLATCRATAQSVRLTGEIPFARPDGAGGLLGFTVAPVRHEDGTLAGFLLVGADITGRKRAEEQLRAANKRLEELNALKDEFVANVSHEFRTPLTAMKGGISLMVSGALGVVNEEQHEFLETVDRNIDRLSELINTMLDLSKIEAGRLRLVRTRVELPQLIESTLKSYRTLAGRRTLQVDLAKIPPVFADAERILQVLGNLFSNAVRFTAEEGTIRLAVRAQDGAVGVSVQDDGVGIAQDDLSKLFQKFSQVGQHREGRPRGTGLGLALCKELVELHRGTIGVTSEPGHGSTFTFTLPVFSPTVALREHFAELIGGEQRSRDAVIGVIVLDVTAIHQHAGGARRDQTGRDLEQVMALVRQHVHHRDVVLEMEPPWVVILASADVQGVRRIVQRLREVLHGWKESAGLRAGLELPFGMALYPIDGTDVTHLVAKAKEGADRGLTALTPGSDPPSGVSTESG